LLFRQLADRGAVFFAIPISIGTGNTSFNKLVEFFSHRLLDAKIKRSGPKVLTEAKQASGLQKATDPA